MSFHDQEVMMVPDKVLKSVFNADKAHRNAIDKLLFPRGVPKSVSRDKQRMVTLVGGSGTIAQTKKIFQDKIDAWQQEREAWLQANATENDKKEIRRDLEMEKLRMGSNQVNSDIIRLRRELAVVEEKLKKDAEAAAAEPQLK